MTVELVTVMSTRPRCTHLVEIVRRTEGIPVVISIGRVSRKNPPETQVGLVEAGDKQLEYRRYSQKPGGLSIRVLQEETTNRQTQKEKNRRRGLQPECRQVVIPPRCFRCLTQQIVLVAGGSGGINPAQSIEVEQRLEGHVVSCTHQEDVHNP